MAFNPEPVPELSKEAQAFTPGVYEHYKGGVYNALCVGRNSEKRGEEFVVYQSFEKGYVWIRPLTMFLESVDVDGETRPRFKLIRAYGSERNV